MIHLFGGLMDSQELENFKAYHEGQHVEYSEESSQISKISDSASIGDDQENDGTESSEFESITKRVQSTPKTTMPKKATKNKDSSPSKEVRASSSHEKDDSDEEIEIAIQRLNKRSPDKDNNLRKRKKLFHQVLNLCFYKIYIHICFLKKLILFSFYTFTGRDTYSVSIGSRNSRSTRK